MNKSGNGMSDNTNKNAVEYDLATIKRLMKGRKRLNPKLAQEIYYKLNRYNIQFKSFKGEEFLNELEHNLTERQKQAADKLLLDQKRRRHKRERFFRLNKYILTAVVAAQLILCLVILNWNIILDIRTSYGVRQLQAKISGTNIERETLSSAAEDEKSRDEDDENGSNKNNADEANQDKSNESVNDTDKQGEVNQPKVMDKFSMLYRENPDFAGWLRIDGTRIDYPVMMRDGDNDYYLDKNFLQQEDKNGLLILDYRSDVLASGQNIIIYGHNMHTGVMFGTLGRYKEKSFCEEHPVISFDSLYEENEYKVIAAVLTEVAYEDEDVFRYYDAIDISTPESFDEFRENILGSALYTTDDSLEYGDSCLVLSTCDNHAQDGRFVVVAKKMPKE